MGIGGLGFSQYAKIWGLILGIQGILEVSLIDR